LEYKVHQEVFKAHKEHKGMPDLMVLLVHKDIPAQQELRLMVPKVCKALMVLREDYKELRGYKETQVFKVFKEEPDLKLLQERKEYKD
jgi:hypothetical protein